MIAPPPRWAMTGMTARAARNVPVRLMPMTRLHAAGSVSVAEPNDSTPAAVIRMSMPPNSATARAAIASTCAGSDTSTASAAARPPAAEISPATAPALPASMSATRTHAPSLANRIAAARPMPEPPPVTTATFCPSLPGPPVIRPPPSAVAAVGPGVLQAEVLDAERGPEREPAVDDHVLARHVLRVVGGQEQDHLGDVVGGAVPAGRDPLEVVGPGDRVVDERAGPPGGAEPGVDRVDPDAVPGEVHGGVADEHHAAALGRAVGHVRLLGEERVGGGEHHDRAAATAGHDPPGRLDGEEHAGEVHVDDPPPQVLRELQQRLQLDHGRRVDEDVDPGEPLDGAGHRRLHVGRLRHVAAGRLHRVAAGPQFGRRRSERALLDVEQGQVRALGAEPLGAGQAHALGAADDQHGLPVEPAHHAPSCPAPSFPAAETRIFTWSPPGSASRSMPLGTMSRIPIRLVITRSTGSVPAAIWARIRGVSQILNDHTPATVRSRQTQPSGCTDRSPRWIAMTATVAARRTEATQASRPAWLPEHSMAQSAPSPPVSSVTSPATSAAAGSKTVAPLRSAISRRAACGSDRKTDPAPAAAATSTASWPIGPPPVTRTLSPGRRPDRSTPCTTVASGSSTAPCSNDTPSGSATTWDAGTMAWPASPPQGQVTPVSCRFEHSPCRPRRQ